MKRALLVACILLAPLVAFACGDDDPEEVTIVPSSTPAPGPDDGTITFPLKEPATIVIADGKEIDLPVGADIGRMLGLGDYTFISLGDSRIYFDTNTWKPVSEYTNANRDDRKDLRKIVDQLSDLFPEHRTEYAELTNSYLKDDLPEQATVKP